jgi:hypothetical protein
VTLEVQSEKLPHAHRQIERGNISGQVQQLSSQQTASPSTVTELARSAATALATSGYRSAQSAPGK